MEVVTHLRHSARRASRVEIVVGTTRFSVEPVEDMEVGGEQAAAWCA